MGGERETILKAGQQPAATGAPVQLGTIRVHQAGGEVHFHDDAAKLKAAIPAPAWWAAWQWLQSGYYTWTYLDPVNQTYLTVISTTTGSAGAPPVSTVTNLLQITITPAVIHPNFLALHQFTKRK